MNAHTRHGCWGKKTVSSFKATNRTRRCCSLLFLRVEAERFLVALFEASVAAESHNAKKKMINPRQKHADDISNQCSHISIRMPFLVFSKAELPESFSSYRKGSLPMIDLYTVPGSDRFGSDRFGSVQISWDLSPWVLSCFFFFFFFSNLSHYSSLRQTWGVALGMPPKKALSCQTAIMCHIKTVVLSAQPVMQRWREKGGIEPHRPHL